MQILGVFEKIYGEAAVMTIDKALLISVVGFCIVFLILSFLAIFVKAMGGAFDSVNAKRDKKTAAVLAAPAVTATASPLPEGESSGTLKLVNVTEEQAAVIMAIVSNKSGIPLNRLQFNSIVLKEDK